MVDCQAYLAALGECGSQSLLLLLLDDLGTSVRFQASRIACLIGDDIVVRRNGNLDLSLGSGTSLSGFRLGGAPLSRAPGSHILRSFHLDFDDLGGGGSLM